MTYPPQGPHGYQVPYQVQPPPERPPQVMTAVILMFAVGFIGILMVIGVAADAVEISSGFGGFGPGGCTGPALHIALGVLGIFVLRGQHGPRVAVYVVAGAAALCDGFLAATSLFNASTVISGYSSSTSGVLVFTAIVITLVMAANVAVIVMLMTGRANAWFTAMRQRPSIAPQQWS